jgi:hypothetical protein
MYEKRLHHEEPPPPPGIYIEYGPEIPRAYGQTFIRLLPRSPSSVFVFWEATFHQPEGSSLAVRLTNLTAGSSRCVEVIDNIGNWYFNDVQPDCEYVAELGFLFRSEFTSMATSNRVRTPRCGPLAHAKVPESLLSAFSLRQGYIRGSR